MNADSPDYEKIEMLLRALDSDQFELAVAFISHEHGWDVEITPKSYDGGFDLYLSTFDRRRLVEVKSGFQAIGPKGVRAAAGSALAQQVGEVAFVASGGYTTGARDAAVDIQAHSAIEAFELVELETLVTAATAIPGAEEALHGIYKHAQNENLILNDQMTLTEYWSTTSLEAQRREDRSARSETLMRSGSMFAV